MGDTLHIEGILRVYELPDELIHDAVYQSAWQRFTLSEKAREARQVVEAHNLITSLGRTQILNFMGASGSTTAFAKQYAVGTGTIYVVQPSDTLLSNELYRAAPASYSVVGNQVTVTTNFAAGVANATYTEAGLFGDNATGTANSGKMFTHLLYSYTKVNGTAIVNDYTLTAT